MVDHAVEITSKSARNRAAQTILRFMRTLNPQVMELDDYMHKLYDQLIIMSDFKLDIDNPYPAPSKTGQVRQSKPFHYRPADIRFRYYGKTLEAMIRKATEMPDGDNKNACLNLITVQMKKSYYLWNADILSDEMVAEHLRILSGGKLVYTEAMRGEVYSSFYDKPSLERKSKYINVSAYENTPRRSYNNGYNNGGYNNYYGNRNYDRGGYNNNRSYNNGGYNNYGNRNYDRGEYNKSGYNNGYNNNNRGYNNGGYNSNRSYNNNYNNGYNAQNNGDGYNRKPRYYNDNKENRPYQSNGYKKNTYQS